MAFIPSKYFQGPKNSGMSASGREKNVVLGEDRPDFLGVALKQTLEGLQERDGSSLREQRELVSQAFKQAVVSRQVWQATHYVVNETLRRRPCHDKPSFLMERSHMEQRSHQPFAEPSTMRVKLRRRDTKDFVGFGRLNHTGEHNLGLFGKSSQMFSANEAA
jgi:hypothetical protein